jgi:hypothetical protein
MNAPWLFAEAYKYRRLHECFSVSKYWKDYDVFYRQKVCSSVHSQRDKLANGHVQCDTFSRSSDAVFELSMRFAEPFKQSENISDEEKAEAERLMFLELTQGPCAFPLGGTAFYFFQQCAYGETLLICRC